jgi:hypothetical protein
MALSPYKGDLPDRHLEDGLYEKTVGVGEKWFSALENGLAGVKFPRFSGRKEERVVDY